MKNLIITVAVLVSLCIFGCRAEAHSFADKDHSHDSTHDHSSMYEKYDYGAFLDIMYGLTDDIDVGVKTTWEVQREEATALVGAVIKFGKK
jgi:hypothetical protein